MECNCSPFVISFTGDSRFFLNVVHLCSKSRVELSSEDGKKESLQNIYLKKEKKPLYT